MKAHQKRLDTAEGGTINRDHARGNPDQQYLAHKALTIIRNGAPQATIVVSKPLLDPPKDDPVAQKVAVAARDLQEYIQKMSGARLPIASAIIP